MSEAFTFLRVILNQNIKIFDIIIFFVKKLKEGPSGKEYVESIKRRSQNSFARHSEFSNEGAIFNAVRTSSLLLRSDSKTKAFFTFSFK